MGLPELPNAPSDITPEKFFGEWLHSQFDTFKPLVEQLAGDLSASLAVKVEGSGEWTCSLSKDGLAVEKGLKEDALTTLILNEKDFLDAVTGKRKNLMQPPAGATPSPEDIPGMLKTTIETLKEIEGMFQFRIEDKDAGDFVVTVKFAGPIKDEPDTIVSVDQEDVEAIAAGELNPQAAFMAGKLRIAGDMGLLMQMAPLMMQ